MRLAIIPARGGSKRIPKKNIKLFHGQPIISYSIETIKRSELFEKIIVSTDDSEIADVAVQYGAEIPFLRPKEISDDLSPTNDVIVHAINHFQDKGYELERVCCVYPTAPFLQSGDLKAASALITDSTQLVFSATEFSYPIFRSFRVFNDNKVEMFWPDNFSKRSQDLEKAYHDAGMFYYGKPEFFLQNEVFFNQYAKAYLMPHYRVQDIDTMDDWYRAEKYFKLLKAD